MQYYHLKPIPKRYYILPVVIRTIEVFLLHMGAFATGILLYAVLMPTPTKKETGELTYETYVEIWNHGRKFFIILMLMFTCFSLAYAITDLCFDNKYERHPRRKP